MLNRRNVVAALAMLAVPGVAQAAKGKDPKVIISINKASQKMTVEVEGRTKYKWPVSTGAKGYDTPSGDFKPFRMEKEHFSKEWDDAPMPYSIFFTGRGHAIHGSYSKWIGRRASHGCVRLSPGNAATLFALVQKQGMSHTRIVVSGGFDLGNIPIHPPQLEKPKWAENLKLAPGLKKLFNPKKQ